LAAHSEDNPFNESSAEEQDSDSDPYDEAMRMSNGNIAAYTSLLAQHSLQLGNKNRYVNPKIEQELIEFKEEIEEKYWASSINLNFKFKRVEADSFANENQRALKT
jgi:hypothetical protein